MKQGIESKVIFYQISCHALKNKMQIYTYHDSIKKTVLWKML